IKQKLDLSIVRPSLSTPSNPKSLLSLYPSPNSPLTIQIIHCSSPSALPFPLLSLSLSPSQSNVNTIVG
ncbi:unnamed protein product, partial [Arabidopsis halleri]